MKIKIPAFIRKYAAYKKEIVSSYDMPQLKKNERIEIINRAVYLVEHGFITIDECMRFIMEV